MKRSRKTRNKNRATWQETGKYLALARSRQSLSQGQLAEKLGYTVNQFVSNWERGLCLPPFSILKKIQKFTPYSSELLRANMVNDFEAVLIKKMEAKK